MGTSSEALAWVVRELRFERWLADLSADGAVDAVDAVDAVEEQEQRPA